MLATYTEPLVTPYTLADIDIALTEGLRARLGRMPSKETRATAMAKCRLESGNGRYCRNHNLGNVKAPVTYVGNFTCFRLNEVVRNQLFWFDPDTPYDPRDPFCLPNQAFPKPSVPDGNPQTRMVSRANRYDGGHFYCEFIFGKPRYASAMQALLAGNPEAYSRELSKAGYYTAPVEVYTKTVVQLYLSSLRFIDGHAPEIENEIAPSKNEWHNQLVLDGFVQGEYLQLQERLNEGSGHALREYERLEALERGE